MYKDIHRVQDALMPTLFQYLVLMHIRHKPEHEEDYRDPMEVLDNKIREAFLGLTRESERKVRNRLARIAKKITEYFIREKFDSRKGFLTLMAWVDALERAGGVIVEGEFRELVDDMKTIIQKGYETIENFDKIDMSAINHVEAIHKLTQGEGYF